MQEQNLDVILNTCTQPAWTVWSLCWFLHWCFWKQHRRYKFQSSVQAMLWCPAPSWNGLIWECPGKMGNYADENTNWQSNSLTALFVTDPFVLELGKDDKGHKEDERHKWNRVQEKGQESDWPENYTKWRELLHEWQHEFERFCQWQDVG